MPRFNGINTDRLESFARKLLGIRQGGIMPSLSPEPALSINLPVAPADDALSGLLPIGAAGVVGAVAAQYAFVQLANISTQGQPILLMGRFRAAPGAAAWVRHAVVPSSATLGGAALTLSETGWRDTRRDSSTSFPQSSSLRFETGTAAAIPVAGTQNLVGGIYHVAATAQDGPMVVLAPQTSLYIYSSVVNVSLYWDFVGWMREAVLPDELEV